MENINLFSTIDLRGLRLRNRIAVSPMQQYVAKDGIVGDWHFVHLGSRAAGGAGLIITECVAVSPEGINTTEDAGLWNDDQLDAWRPVVKFVRRQGAKIAIQLWHAGGKGSHKHERGIFTYLPPEEGGRITKSASPIKLDDQHFSAALTLEEIDGIKNDFIESAKRAVEAGFDTIELHAGHGYIFHQFYSSLVNHREDHYGGSFENRIRLLIETVDAIRLVIPAEMPLLARISAVDHSHKPEAWTIDDSKRLAVRLKEAGVDMITASSGGFVPVDRSAVFPNYQVPYAVKLMETGVVVGAVGMITDAEQANQIITGKSADIVVIGREFLRDPYFPINAARKLGFKPDVPEPYVRAYL